MGEPSRSRNLLANLSWQIIVGVIVALLAAVIGSWIGLDRLNNNRCLDPDLQHTVTGFWEQYLRPPGSQEWLKGGSYRVYIDGECLAMEEVDISTVSRTLITSNGIADVKFNGTEWSFHSHSQTGLVATFKLERISDTQYEGYSYIDGKRADENRWIKLPNR